MEKKIYKYTLQTTDEQVINLPKGAEILTVQAQFNEPQLWALIDLEKTIINQHESEMENITITTYGAGQIITDYEIDQRYIGTYQLDGGNYVFHVFEKISK